ncbi:hypothetical protein KI387_020963, partial [Taxus chinensis]
TSDGHGRTLGSIPTNDNIPFEVDGPDFSIFGNGIGSLQKPSENMGSGRSERGSSVDSSKAGFSHP